MKKVYISHPLRGTWNGNPQEEWRIALNKLCADAVCRALVQRYAEEDILFLSPIHAYSFIDPEGDDIWVMDQCLNLLSMVNELWVFGNWESSEGCRMEIFHADMLGIPVRYAPEAEYLDMIRGVEEVIAVG